MIIKAFQINTCIKISSTMDQTSQSFKIPPLVLSTLYTTKFVDLASSGTTTMLARKIDHVDFWEQKCRHLKMPEAMLFKWRTMMECKINGEMWRKKFKDMCMSRDFSGDFKSPLHWLLEHTYPDDLESIVNVQKVFANECTTLYQWMVEEFESIGFFSPVGNQCGNHLIVEPHDRSIRFHFEVISNDPKPFKIEWIRRCHDKLQLIELDMEKDEQTRHVPKSPPLNFWPNIHKSLFRPGFPF